MRPGDAITLLCTATGKKMEEYKLSGPRRSHNTGRRVSQGFSVHNIRDEDEHRDGQCH